MNKRVFTKISQISIFIIMPVLVLSLLSCTRNISDKVKVSLSSGPGAQSLGELKVIIINITGPGLNPPLYYLWEQCHEENCYYTPPTEFEFEIPKGPNRLFQVLAAYEDEANFNVSFQYGDITKVISNANETVGVTLGDVGSGGQQFDFGGRYCRNAAGTDCPSGYLSTYYSPPGGRPPMFIEENLMVDGWFKTFGINDAGLNYFLFDISNGSKTTLFQNVNLNTSFPATQQMLQVNVPIHAYLHDLNMDNYAYGSTEYEMSGSSQIILGYFGHPSYTTNASRAVCYRTNITALQSIWVDNGCDLENAPGCLLSSGSHIMGWDTAAGTSSINMSRTNTNYGLLLATASSPCTSPASLHNATTLYFDPEAFKNGEDNLIGIKGPFASWNNGSDSTFLQLTYGDFDTQGDAEDLKIDWKYLEGASTNFSSMFDGIDFFVMEDISNFNMDTDYLDCSTLEDEGYVLSGTLAPSALETYTIEDIGGVTSQQTAVIACPYVGSPASHYYVPGSVIYNTIVVPP